jgi:beta-N-acetylhexosaminidase
VAEALAQLGAHVDAIAIEETASVDVISAAAGRSLVLVVRNLHRHAWMAAAVEAALAQRPDAILVEMGLPACRPAGATAYVATYGAARVCGLAAAEVLMGR